MDQTPRLGLLIPKEGTNGYTVMARTLCIVDAMMNPVIKSKTIATPPADAQLGDLFIVPTGGTDDWAGQDGKAAIKTELGWEIVEQFDGLRGPVVDEGRSIVSSDGTTITESNIDGGVAAPVFGTQYQFVKHEGELTTSSGSYQQKLRLTTASVPAGDYRVAFNAELGNTDDKETAMRIQLDGGYLLAERNVEIADSADWLSGSGHDCMPLTAGVHNIDIDLKAGDQTAKIRRMHLEIWRVG